jgi:hypothetical protein
VIDEQLRASCEQIGEGGCALVGLETLFLVDPDPGQLLPPPRQFVATPRQRLLGLEQLQPGGKPLFGSTYKKGILYAKKKHGFREACFLGS